MDLGTKIRAFQTCDMCVCVCVCVETRESHDDSMVELS
jgi:hypothetical protein